MASLPAEIAPTLDVAKCYMVPFAPSLSATSLYSENKAAYLEGGIARISQPEMRGRILFISDCLEDFGELASEFECRGFSHI